MIKIKTLLFALLLVSFAACSSDDDEMVDVGDTALVGTWAMSESGGGIDISLKATFNANYSGTIVSVITFEGTPETQTEDFTWSTSVNKLTLVIAGETEIVTYSISGDTLTITDQDGDTVLTRE
jgi:hypothetical protein